jgi:isopenicillin N synthase-like dioxygenase
VLHRFSISLVSSSEPLLQLQRQCSLQIPAFYTGNEDAKTKLVEEVRKCCLHNGFFQITGHRVPGKLQQAVLDCLKEFFALPQLDKEKVLKGKHGYH